MSYLFFLDESGQDQHDSPYEVRCAVAVHDSRLWDLIQETERCELEHFGRPYSGGDRELKAKKLLKRKTFRLATQAPEFDPQARRELAKDALDHGEATTRDALTALSQAKIAFCGHLLDHCDRHQVTYFATMVQPGAPRSEGQALRKDYSYLFQRLFYFLEQQDERERGLLVMDELDQVEARLLVSQMHIYFQETGFGRVRARRIVPQPFFVHSHLTTGVQIADLVAYILSWSVRLPGMQQPARPELHPLGERVRAHDRQYWVQGLTYPVQSFAYLRDLRPRNERDLDSRTGPAVQQLVARFGRGWPRA